MLKLINKKEFIKLKPQKAVQNLENLTEVLSRKEVYQLASSITKKVKKLNNKEKDKFISFIINRAAGRESIDDIALAFKISGINSEKEWSRWYKNQYGELNPPHLSFKKIKNENDNGLWRLFFSEN